MTDDGLAAEGVSFAYPRRTTERDGRFELTGVTARAGRGSLLGILGPNGSGKTTLLRLLGGLLTPDAGRVTLDGIDLRTMRRAIVARRMAMVPQETHLAFEYTALEIATMGRYPHLRAFEIEGPADLEVARDALRATGTLHLASRMFNTLSGGEKQRVVIAGALTQLSPGKGVGRGFSGDRGENPLPTPSSDILLLDEPTASLDLAYQLEIRSILQALNAERNLTIIVSTHDLNLAASLCRELILLDRGRVLAAGPTHAMLQPSLIRMLYGVEVDITTNVRTGQLTVFPVAKMPELPRA